jgi:hypothetical protein
MEEPRDDLPAHLLESLRLVHLPFKYGAELRSEREHPALPILRLAWLESRPTRIEIEVTLLRVRISDFVRHPGSSKNPLSAVALVECGVVWRLHDKASPLPEP